MFPARYHGTTFDVTYLSDPAQKVPTRAHLITSRDSFELISLDWKTPILTCPAAELASVESKKNSAILTFKPNSKLTQFSLSTKPEPLEPLVAALTQIFALPRTEPRFLALRTILPSFKFAEEAQTKAAQKGIREQTAQFMQAFCSSAGSIAVNGAFVDVFSCVFRMRYRNESVQPVDASVKALGQDVRRHLISLWCSGILKCLKPTDSANAKLFYSRLATNAVQTVGKAASRVGISCDDLVKAMVAFAEPSGKEAIEAAAKRIAKEANEASERELARKAPFDLGQLPLLLNLAVIVLAGIAGGMYAVDVDALAEKVVDFTQAVLAGGRAEEKKRALLQEQNIFLRDFVSRLDGQRYDEPFQFIFCIWGLRSRDLT
jgi:hypothetical protein